MQAIRIARSFHAKILVLHCRQSCQDERGGSEEVIWLTNDNGTCFTVTKCQPAVPNCACTLQARVEYIRPRCTERALCWQQNRARQGIKPTAAQFVRKEEQPHLPRCVVRAAYVRCTVHERLLRAYVLQTNNA